jgi:16S rRNA (guanine966-N2)-methyltransferase
MRIIAGKFRSRQLRSLKSTALRPTSDRLRETLFNILGDLVAGSRFIDAFAGTGAVGIEALSRGAKEVIFIEKHAATAALIKKNLGSLQIQKDEARVLPIDVLHALERLARENSGSREVRDILFLDPPYDHAAEYDRVLSFLGSATLLNDGALVTAEHRSNFELPETVENLQRVRVLRQGDATLSFYRLIKSP